MAQDILIRVFDRDLNFLGEIDDYDAVLYIRRWTTYGEFQISMSYPHPLLVMNHIIMVNSDKHKNGIIKYIQYDEAEGTYTVKGFSLLWLMSQRITPPAEGDAYQTYNMRPEQILRNLVHINAIAPSDSTRAIPRLVLGDVYVYGDPTTYTTRYNNLLSDLSDVAKAYGYGIGIDLDWEKKQMIFRILRGVDRTAQQSANKRCIFRDSYDNIDKQVYTVNDLETKNCAYVAGRGEGADRKISIVGGDIQGLERREVFIDARDVEDDNRLPERGQVKLAAMKIAENYAFEVDPIKYESDWDLGDIVTVISDTHGITLNDQVLEVEEAVDISGVQIIPTIGEPEKTIAEKISSGSTGSSGGGSGTATAGTYIHTQSYPNTEWTITHNLGNLPSVTVVDSSGSVVVGETMYIDRNTIQVSFSAAFAGMAYLN